MDTSPTSPASASQGASKEVTNKKRKAAPDGLTPKQRRLAADAAAQAKKEAAAAKKKAEFEAAIAAFEEDRKKFKSAVAEGQLPPGTRFFKDQVYGKDVLVLAVKELFKTSLEYDDPAYVNAVEVDVDEENKIGFSNFSYWCVNGSDAFCNEEFVHAALTTVGRQHTRKDGRELLCAIVAAMGRKEKDDTKHPVMCTLKGFEGHILLPPYSTSSRGHYIDYSHLVSAVVAALAFGRLVYTNVELIGDLIKVLGLMEKPVKDEEDEDEDDEDEEDEARVPLFSVDPDLVAGTVATVCATIVSAYAQGK